MEKVNLSDKRLLIFIVAYNAEMTLASVLDRIPSCLWLGNVEVLVIDDASSDATFECGVDYEQHDRSRNIRVLRTPENQGYGGNQKLGYRYAIDNGFDYVGLVHGDGQYAPEKLPELLEPLVDGDADAVFGSRMLVPGAARRGGMPLYKYVGNRILTTTENFLLKSDLSEFHSGYRVYSVKALAAIPFERNTNDFHFDTEIIIQLLLAEKTIKEVPIPTYYGDEICRVNGLRYALDVVLSVLRVRFHQISLLYDRKYDVGQVELNYGLKLGYTSSHTLAIAFARGQHKVLDIGCGQGLVANALAKAGCHVTGVDQYVGDDTPHHANVSLRQTDLNACELPADTASHDIVVLLDIIEHLQNPEVFMETLRAALAGGRARVMITTGNVGFFVVRFGLFFGQFNYGRKGILDRTHTRLFTFRTLRELLEQSGFTVTRMRGIPVPFPEALGLNAFSRLLLFVNSALIKVLPKLFSYQVMAEANARPTVSRLLAETLASRDAD